MTRPKSWLLFFRQDALMKTPVVNADPRDLVLAAFAGGWEGAWLCDSEPDLEEAQRVIAAGEALGSMDCTIMLYVKQAALPDPTVN